MTKIIGKIGFTPKDEFVPGHPYEEFDVVSYDGGSYVSRVNENTALPTDASKWFKQSERGAKGDTGEKGDKLKFVDLTPEEKLELKGDVVLYNSMTEAEKEDLASKIPISGTVIKGNTNAVSGDVVKSEFNKITTESKNKYNPDTRVVGMYLSPSSGLPITENVNIDTTDKIKIEGNKIVISGSGNASKYRAIHFYDINGVYLPVFRIAVTEAPNLSYVLDISNEISAGAYSVAVSFANAVLDYQIEFGDTVTSYVPYGILKIKPESLPAIPIADGSVVASKIADKAVDLDKTVFGIVGKNKCNPNAITTGKYLNNGDLLSNIVYSTTDFISFPKGLSVDDKIFLSAVNPETNGGRFRFYSFYDKNKTYIQNSFSTVPQQFQDTFIEIPQNIKESTEDHYLKVTIYSAASNIQVEFGTTHTTFQNYKKVINKDFLEGYVEDNSVTTDKIVNNSVSPSKTNFFSVGKNKFNLDDILEGYYISGQTPSVNGVYNTSGFIDLPDDRSLEVFISALSNLGQIGRFVTFWTKNGINLTDLMLEGKTHFSLPQDRNAVKMRFSYIANATGIQLEFGNAKTTYEPYYFGIKEEFLPPKTDAENIEDFKLFLPKEICVAVGRTIELYNSQVAWCGNINDYHFLWTGVGRSMKRKWSLTGTNASIGNMTLRCRVFDKNNVLVADKTTIVRVVDNVIANEVNITAIGDSLSNTKPWCEEVKLLSSNKVNFIGTRGAIALSYRHEGRSGATSIWYLGNNSYTYENNGIEGNDGRSKDLNPFWNPTTQDIDFNYYKSNYNQNPTALNIWLGTNGITVNPDSNAINIKTFIDKIRATGGENIKIFVIHTLFRGGQDGIGKQTGVDGYVASSAYKLEEDLKVFNLQVKLHELLNNYANLYLVPVSTCHDSEFNFGAVSTPVNPRASQVEYLPNEATHPQLQGYLQIADVIFSSYCANL